MARPYTPDGAVKVRKLRVSASVGTDAADAIRRAIFPDETGITVQATGALSVEINVPIEGDSDVAMRAAAAERMVAQRIGDLRSVTSNQSRAMPDALFESSAED